MWNINPRCLLEEFIITRISRTRGSSNNDWFKVRIWHLLTAKNTYVIKTKNVITLHKKIHQQSIVCSALNLCGLFHERYIFLFTWMRYHWWSQASSRNHITANEAMPRPRRIQQNITARRWLANPVWPFAILSVCSFPLSSHYCTTVIKCTVWKINFVWHTGAPYRRNCQQMFILRK